MESKSGNVLENTHGCSRDSVRVLMAYDGSGKRVSKTRMRKERDDETELNYFGARYLDPMLGLWISVDPARQFSSPYLYMGNGTNPIILTDTDGNVVPLVAVGFTVVKGALVGVGAGMAFDFAKSRCKGDGFNYTVGDALVDGSFGIAAAVTKTGVTDLLGTIVAEKVGKEAVVKGAKFGVSKVLKNW